MSNKHPLWKAVGKLAIEKAVETLVEEGVEASVEIWKKYRLKLQKEWFDQRKEKRDAVDASPETAGPESSSGNSDAQDDDDQQQAGSARSSRFAARNSPQGDAGGSRLESFTDFVERRESSRSS